LAMYNNVFVPGSVFRLLITVGNVVCHVTIVGHHKVRTDLFRRQLALAAMARLPFQRASFKYKSL